MRTIKFRVWNSIHKKMYTVDSIWGLNDDRPQVRCRREDEERTPEEKLLRSVFGTKKIHEIMQYTGLNDKNGKEIYEGDVIQFDGEEEYGVVEWSESDAVWGYTLKWDGLTDELPLCSWIEDKAIPFEIIGNIYESPELIK